MGSLVQVIGANLATAGTSKTSTAISTTAGNTLAFCAVYKAVNAGTATPSDSTTQNWGAPLALYSGGATGLTLAVWIARNITGNAANTFTLSTTGNDTPTFFVAEFSGRDIFVPLDLYITASDSVSASGAHTTGTIFATGGDDLLAFNVSSSLSQSYTATGLWAIPPNGTYTGATGYDAFVQYINAANNGPNANTYSVGVADKLDAFIIGLKPPALPYSDEGLDYFNEVPEVYSWANSYQQTTLLPQILDIDQDWLDEAGDNEAWALVETSSAPVVANVATNSTAQYYGEVSELLDEFYPVQIYDSYQNVDFSAPLGSFNIDEQWDFQRDEDYNGAYVPGGYQNADLIDTTSLVLDAVVVDDGDDDTDDFFADDYGNDDADLPQNDPWDHWLTDDDDYFIVDEYPTANGVAPTPLVVEDGWDQEHFGTEDPDVQWSQDDYLNPPNPLLNLEDGWNIPFDDFADQNDEFWWIENETDYQLIDNNPVINTEDPWDHWSTDDDDYVVIDDYAIVDLITSQVITVEDPFDQFVTDDDDYFIVDEYALITVVIPFAMPPEDPWDQTQAEDDYVIPDDYAIVDVALNLGVPVQDAWDWANTDEDDYAVIDDYQSVNNTPITVEDAWEHFVTDGDDDTWQALDTDQVQANEPCPADPWDFSQDADDEEWVFRDASEVEPFVGLNNPTDGWDHFTADDDDWAIPDDYAYVNAPVFPSLPIEDAFDFFYEPAEDNDMDFGTEFAPLANSVYQVNPNFEVYMQLGNWVVTWLPGS